MVIAVRIFGWIFVPLSVIFIFVTIYVLFDPQIAVTVNGVKRTDTTAKLLIAIIPLPGLGMGLFLLLIPKSWIAAWVGFEVGQIRRLKKFFGRN
jgi:hypothetical protein